jgi:hypothetical protein
VRSINPVPNNAGGAGGAWPLETGNDFLPNHLANGIDYASIHEWPDNWGRTDKAFGQAWLQAHIDDTKYLGKPLVLEEFGKAVGAWPNPTCLLWLAHTSKSPRSLSSRSSATPSVSCPTRLFWLTELVRGPTGPACFGLEHISKSLGVRSSIPKCQSPSQRR